MPLHTFRRTTLRSLVALVSFIAIDAAAHGGDGSGKPGPTVSPDAQVGRSPWGADDEIGRLNRRGPFPVGVLAVDLNGLKATNDEFGHSAGDALLRRAGEALKKALGDNMQAARVGGDEFACLLPRNGEAEMANLAESIKMVVDLNNQFYQGPRLSLAVGTAVCKAPGELEKALRAADDAMYAAKRSHYQGTANDRRDGP